VLKGNSVLGVLVKEAKRYNAMSVVVGVKQQSKLSLKIAKGCAKELPSTTDILAIHRGNIVFRRSNHYQLPLGSLVLFTTIIFESIYITFFKLEPVDQKWVYFFLQLKR
jgi:hypothetical protein